MGREFSIYLDIVRFSAAALVFLHHLNKKSILLADAPLSGYGNSAVMIFFVLSGYVIAFVSDTREKDIKTYTVNRCGRIYSVAIPAVILTPILDFFGRAWFPELYAGLAPSDYWLIRTVSSLFFTNELWFVSIMSFSNLPYWSLNYEVWYYILFAAVIFLSGRVRLVAIILILFVMGPKIALLAPIWWIGVLLYQREKVRQVSEVVAWIFLVFSIVLIFLFVHFSVEEYLRQWLREVLGEHNTRQLVSSQFFLSHYLLAIIVAMHFLAMNKLAFRFRAILLRLETPIRFLASYTFVLYLMHLPLILFFAALYRGDPSGWSYYITIVVSVILSMLLIGQFTEKKKETFRSVFNYVFDNAIRLQKKLLHSGKRSF